MSGLQMKYFVLKPKGNDEYAAASRKAMRAYAMHIHSVNKELSDQLMEWAKSESFEMINQQDSETKKD